MSDGDVSSIRDEDVLRRMWQQTEDFSRKKEIRAHMYRLREERLRNLYTPEPSGDGKDLKALSNAGWNVEQENRTTDDGHTHVKSVNANIEGRYDVEGGKGQFAAVDHHREAVTEYQDENSSLKRNETSSNTAAREHVVRQTDDGTHISSTTSSSTSASKFQQVSSTRHDTVPYVTDDDNDLRSYDNTNRNEEVTRRQITKTNDYEQNIRNDYNNGDLLSRKVEYPDDNTRVIVETRRLPDGTRVTSTKREFRVPVQTRSEHYQTRENKSYSTQHRSDIKESTSKVTKQVTDRSTDIVDSQRNVDDCDFKRQIHEYVTPGHDDYDVNRHDTKIKRVVDRSKTDDDYSQTTRYETRTKKVMESTDDNDYVQTIRRNQQRYDNDDREVIIKRDDRTYNNQQRYNDDREIITTRDDRTHSTKHHTNDDREVIIKRDDRTYNNQQRYNDDREIITTRDDKTHSTEHHTDHREVITKRDDRTHTIQRHTDDSELITKHDDKIYTNQQKYTNDDREVVNVVTQRDDHATKRKDIRETQRRDTEEKIHNIKIDKKVEEIVEKKTTTDHQTTYSTDYTQKKVSNDWSPSHQAWASTLRADTPTTTRPSTRASSPGSRTFKSSTSSIRSSVSPDKTYRKPTSRGGSPSKVDRYSPTRTVSDRYSTHSTHSVTETKTHKYTSPEDRRPPTGRSPTRPGYSPERKPQDQRQRPSVSPEKRPQDHTHRPSASPERKPQTSPIDAPRTNSPTRPDQRKTPTSAHESPEQKPGFQPKSDTAYPRTMSPNRPRTSPEKTLTDNYPKAGSPSKLSQSPDRKPGFQKPGDRRPSPISEPYVTSPSRPYQPTDGTKRSHVSSDRKPGYPFTPGTDKPTDTFPKDTVDRNSTSPDRRPGYMKPTAVSKSSDDLKSPTKPSPSPDAKSPTKYAPSQSPDRRPQDYSKTTTKIQEDHYKFIDEETKMYTKTDKKYPDDKEAPTAPGDKSYPRDRSLSPSKKSTSEDTPDYKGDAPSKRSPSFKDSVTVRTDTTDKTINKVDVTSKKDDYSEEVITKYRTPKDRDVPEVKGTPKEKDFPSDKGTPREPSPSKYGTYDKKKPYDHPKDIKAPKEDKYDSFPHDKSQKRVPDQPTSPTKKSPREIVSPAKSPTKDTKYKHTTDFITTERTTEEINKKTTKDRPRQLITPSSSPTRTPQSTKNEPSTGHSSPTTSASGFVYFSSPRPEKTIVTDLDDQESYTDTVTTEEITTTYKRPESLNVDRSPSPSKIPCRSPSPGKRVSPSKDSLPRKSSLKKPTDTNQPSPVEKPPSNFHVSPDEPKDFPEHRVVKKDHPERPDTDTPGKCKPPLERRETYEDRCRKILGMTTDTTTETIVKETTILKEPQPNLSSPSASPKHSPTSRETPIGYSTSKKTPDTKTDVTDFISREQEHITKTTTREDDVPSDKKSKTPRETSPTKLQDIISKTQTVVDYDKTTIENTQTDTTITSQTKYARESPERKPSKPKDVPSSKKPSPEEVTSKTGERPGADIPMDTEYPRTSPPMTSDSSPRDNLSPERRLRHESPEKPTDKYPSETYSEKIPGYKKTTTSVIKEYDSKTMDDFEKTTVISSKMHQPSRPSESPSRKSSKPSDDTLSRTSPDRKPIYEHHSPSYDGPQKKPDEKYPREPSPSKPGYMQTTKSVTSKLDTTDVKEIHTLETSETPTRRAPKTSDTPKDRSPHHKPGYEQPTRSSTSPTKEIEHKQPKEPEVTPGYMRTTESVTSKFNTMEDAATCKIVETRHPYEPTVTPSSKTPKPIDKYPFEGKTGSHSSPDQFNPMKESSDQYGNEASPKTPGYTRTTGSVTSKYYETNVEETTLKQTETTHTARTSESPTRKAPKPQDAPIDKSPHRKPSYEQPAPSRSSPVKEPGYRHPKEPEATPGYMRTTESVSSKFEKTEDLDEFTSKLVETRHTPRLTESARRQSPKTLDDYPSEHKPAYDSSPNRSRPIKEPIDKYPTEPTSKTPGYMKTTESITSKYDSKTEDYEETVKNKHVPPRPSDYPTRKSSKPSVDSPSRHLFDESSRRQPKISPERKPGDKLPEESSPTRTHKTKPSEPGHPTDESPGRKPGFESSPNRASPTRQKPEKTPGYMKSTESATHRHEMTTEDIKEIHTSKSIEREYPSGSEPHERLQKVTHDAPCEILTIRPSPSRHSESPERKPGHEKPPQISPDKKPGDMHPKVSSPSRPSMSPTRTISKPKDSPTRSSPIDISGKKTDYEPSPRASPERKPVDKYTKDSSPTRPETDSSSDYTRKTTSVTSKYDITEDHETITSQTTKSKPKEPQVKTYSRTPTLHKAHPTEETKVSERKAGPEQPSVPKEGKPGDKQPKESSPTRSGTSPDRKPSYMKPTASVISKHETTKTAEEIHETTNIMKEKYPSSRSSVSPTRRAPDEPLSMKPKYHREEPEEPEQLHTPSPTKKYTEVTEISTDFIMSEREQEVLDKVQKSLRKLSPERKENSPSREISPGKTTTSLLDLDITSHTIDNDEYTDVIEITDTKKTSTIDTTRLNKPKDEKLKDQKVPSKPSSRNVSPTKKPSGLVSPTKIDKGPELLSKQSPRSVSPRKPFSPTERPQSPQAPRTSGIKPKDQVASHLTRKPTPATLSPTKQDKNNTDVRKTTGTTSFTKQTTSTKTSTIKYTSKVLQSPTGKEPETKRASTPKGIKDASKKDTDTKVTRITSEITMKPKKTSPQRMKSKPEIQVSDMSAKSATTQMQKSPKEPHTKLPSKSATTLNTSIDDDDVIIDVEQSKSSRENSPDRICPTPVNFGEDVGTPRFPDEVKEPDDEFRKRTHQTIHETESIVDDIVEICEDDELFVRKTYPEKVSEDDESLLSVTDKVTKFTKRVETKPKDNTNVFKDTERRVHSDFIDENLKSDECLLSVSEKVNKFAKGPRDIKDKSPVRNVTDEYDRNTTYQDDYTKLSVHDKAHLFVETAENVKAPKVKPAPQKVGRPDLSNVDDSLKSDDCLLSVSDKVNKFVKTAEHFMSETQDVEEKERKIQEQHDKIMRKIVDDVDDDTFETEIPTEVEDIEERYENIPKQRDVKPTFVKETVHGKIKDYSTPNLKPSDKAPTVKITTLRSSEAVKKAKALFENIASTTQKTKETTSKTTKLTDIGVVKKGKPDSTTVHHPTVEDSSPNVTDVDSEMETTSQVRDQPSSSTLTRPHQPRDEKPRASPSRLTTQSLEVPRSKSPMQHTVETTTTKTVTTRYTGAPRTESPKPRPESEQPDKVPGYLRPTKTSQNKEEPKVEENEVSSRRGSGKFGVELRRTSVERSTVSSERRRSVEHPCIEDIYDLDLLEQMLEKVVGYEQRRRIRAQIRIAKKKVETEHVADTNTYTRTKHTTVQKASSPERQQTRSPERTPKTTHHQKPASPDRQSKTPQRSVPDRAHPKDHPVLNGHSKEPSKTLIDKRQRPHSPEKPKAIPKTKSPVRPASPEKKIRMQSPMKTSTPKPKTNRFNEYASAYMKKVGLNEADKIKFAESKTKKIVDDKRKVVRQVEEHTTVEEYSTTKNVTERTSSKDVIEIVQVNGKRSPSPEKRQSPVRKAQSPVRKALSPDRKTSPERKAQSPERIYQRTPSPELKRPKSETGKSQHKETIIKTVYDIDKKIPQKQTQEEKPSWVTNRNLKKTTAETRTFSSKKIEEKPTYRASSPSKVLSKPIDVITSSYGPGPLDADGKPLFGIRALRNGASKVQVKGTVIRQEYHSRNGGEPEGTVSVTAYSTEPEDLEKLLQGQGEPPSRIHGLAAITTTKKFGGETGTTLKEVHGKDERAAIDQFTHSDRRVIDSKIEEFTDQSFDTQEQIVGDSRRIETRREEITEDRDRREGDRMQRRVEKVVERKGQKMDTRERVERADDKKTVRQSSVKSLTEKYIKSANESSKTDRSTYPKAGLILRTSTMKDSVSSDSSAHAGLARTDSEHSLGSVEDTTVVTTTEQCDGGVRTVTTTRTQGHVKRGERSFLDSSTKVTGVQDILTRMKNADIVIQEGDTTEDTEARALLNKFLGATVLMAGMQGYVSEKPSGKVVVKQETVRTSSSGGKVTSSQSRSVEEIDIDQCWDERVLRKLLDECSDYEQRRRLRARIRTLMAEQEACASAVTEALAAAGEAGDGGEGSEAREEEEVTVTSSVRRDSSEKTVSSTTTTKTSKVIESMTRPAPKPVSPFAKFRQLEKQNSTNSPKM